MCSARATSSLPVPVSPVIKIGGSMPTPSTLAMRSMRCFIASMAGWAPRMAYSAERSLASRYFRRPESRWVWRMDSSLTASSRSDTGLVIRSVAPAFIASTASSMVPWPVMSTMCTWGSASRTRWMNSRPVPSGSR